MSVCVCVCVCVCVWCVFLGQYEMGVELEELEREVDKVGIHKCTS